eukprot:scaffold40874_cov62-Phaeocystis_antarctica.AAC.1
MALLTVAILTMAPLRSGILTMAWLTMAWLTRASSVLVYLLWLYLLWLLLRLGIAAACVTYHVSAYLASDLPWLLLRTVAILTTSPPFRTGRCYATRSSRRSKKARSLVITPTPGSRKARSL